MGKNIGRKENRKANKITPEDRRFFSGKFDHYCRCVYLLGEVFSEAFGKGDKKTEENELKKTNRKNEPKKK